MSDPIRDLSTLVPGRRYKVHLDDCCIDGWFIDTYVGPTRDVDGDVDGWAFAAAWIGPPWGKVEFEEYREVGP